MTKDRYLKVILTAIAVILTIDLLINLSVLNTENKRRVDNNVFHIDQTKQDSLKYLDLDRVVIAGYDIYNWYGAANGIPVYCLNCK